MYHTDESFNMFLNYSGTLKNEQSLLCCSEYSVVMIVGTNASWFHAIESSFTATNLDNGVHIGFI
jgi:hypothetical protein